MADLATNTTPGEIYLAGDLGGNNDATAPELSASGVIGGQYDLAQLTINGKGLVTNAQGSDPSVISALLQPASTTQVGVVQAGNGLDVTSAETSGYQEISFALSITGTEATGLDACASYLIDINIDAIATQTIVISGNIVTIQDVVDEINIALSGAVASIVGGVIRITSNTSGRASFVEIVNDALFGCMTDFNAVEDLIRGTADCEMFASDATISSKGIVQIGTGIAVNAGVISVDPNTLPIATATEVGGVIVPTSGNLNIDISGNISVPIATDVILGVMRVPVGDGLELDVSGNLTFDQTSLSDATTGSKGIVQIGTNLAVTAGVVSVADATLASKGVIQIGNGLTVSGGVVSVDPGQFLVATETTVGTVSVPTGNGLAVDGAGSLTMVPANGTATLGGVKSANANNISIVSGDVDVGSNIAKLDTSNTYTKSQTVSLSTLISGATINVDADLSNTFNVILDTNATLANPTNLNAGQTIVFIIKQDVTGSRTLAFGTTYKFRGGVVPVATQAPNGVDVMTCISDGTNLYCSYNKGFA